MARSGPRPTTTADARSRATRAALVSAAIDALREVGFAGASAREIAGRAGAHQSQVFYHFGSVTQLLLAALDEISLYRLESYRAALAEAKSLSELIEASYRIFVTDLDAGHIAVLVQMINGAQTVPGLAVEVAARLQPWRDLALEAVQWALQWSPLGPLVPADEIAHGVVAALLGLEVLTTLDDDRDPALALFSRARLLAGLLAPPALPGHTLDPEEES